MLTARRRTSADALLCANPRRASVSPRQSMLSQHSDAQLASTFAGVTSRILLHPIDCVKTRLQYIRGRPGSSDASRHLIRFIASEGLPGLYRGIIGALAGVLPYSMLYMPSYELAQMQLSRFGQEKLLGIRHVVAGSFAGLCGSLVKVPVDVVKKRLQAGIYPHIGAAVTSIASEGSGVAGSFRQFYTGWRSSIIYDVPYSAIQFTVLENVKQCVRRLKRSELVGIDHVIVGALTGMITSVVTEPLDVIKTRLMTQRMKGVRPGITMYRGWLHCMRTIVHEEGPLALWKGTLPRLIWVGASSAIWYGTYQAVRQSMNQKRQLAANSESDGSSSQGVK